MDGVDDFGDGAGDDDMRRAYGKRHEQKARPYGKRLRLRRTRVCANDARLRLVDKGVS